MYKYFKQLLDSRQLRTADVAKATGLPKSMFSEWKNGRSNPKVDKLMLIADYVGVSLDYLVRGRLPGIREDDVIANTISCLMERGEVNRLMDLAMHSSDDDVKVASLVLKALRDKAK